MPGKQQRDRRKKRREHREQALANGLVPNQIELRGDVRDTKAVMPLRDDLAERVGERQRVLPIGVNHEGGKADGPRRGFVVPFSKGNVEDGAIGRAQVVVRCVGGDADDPVDGLVGAAFKSAADRVLAWEKSFGESLVDDGGSRRVCQRGQSRGPKRGESSSSQAIPEKRSVARRESDWEARH